MMITDIDKKPTKLIYISLYRLSKLAYISDTKIRTKHFFVLTYSVT